MPGGIDRLADCRDRREAAGRGLVVQHADRLDLLVLVLAQMLFDCRRVGADAPVGRDEFRHQAELLGHVLPQGRELAGLDHQHAVTGRERVDERSLPRAGAGGGVHDDRVRGLEDGLDALEAALGELGEFRSAVIDDRRIHRPQHAVGERGRARDLQEVAADGTRGVLGHRQVLAIMFFRRVQPTVAAGPRVAAACRHQGRMQQSVKPPCEAKFHVACPGRARLRARAGIQGPHDVLKRKFIVALRDSCAGSRVSFRARARVTRPGHEAPQ